MFFDPSEKSEGIKVFDFQKATRTNRFADLNLLNSLFLQEFEKEPLMIQFYYENSEIMKKYFSFNEFKQ